MINNGNMPAMPCEVVEQYHIDPVIAPDGSSMPTLRERKVMSGGMTKREMMAMHMFAGLLARDGKPDIQYEAELAIKAAGALLAELERTK